MRSLKEHFLARRNKIFNQYKDERVIMYLERKLKRKKYKDEQRGYYWPVRELKILHIAKATRLSYQQVRDRLDKFVREGKLEKWTTGTSYKKNGNYYRLRASG